MVVKHGGRGPGHLSRWPKAASGASDGHPGSKLMLENETDAILLEGDATDGNDTLLMEA